MTKSQYERHADQLEAVANAAEQAASDAKEITSFLLRHEQEGVIFCDANKRIIFDYFHGEDITDTALEDSWDNHPNFKKSLARRQSDAEVRAQLVKEIFELAPGSHESKNHVASQLRYKTIEEIIIQRDELQRRKDLKNLPKEKLRELARTPLHPQFKPVEPLYQSREMILSASPAELRRLIRVSGLIAINEILSNSKKAKD